MSETIIKIKKRDNPYVMIDKAIADDCRLSWKAKGLLLYLLSKPNDWQVYLKELALRAKDGLKSVQSGIKELLAVGYIERHRIRNQEGQYVGMEYIVREKPSSPVETPQTQNGVVDYMQKKPQTGFPRAENGSDKLKKDETKKLISDLAKQKKTTNTPDHIYRNNALRQADQLIQQ